MNKRGISAVVATVLIILLVVSGVGIVWLGIMPMIADINIDKSAGLRLVSTEGHTLWDPESRLATVQIERAADGPDVYGIDIVFSFSGNSVTHFVEDVPGLNGKLVYHVNLSEYPGELDSIKIVPIFWGGIAGGVASELKIERIPEADIVEMIEEDIIVAEEFVEPTGYSGGGGGSGGSSSGGDNEETSTCNNNVIESGETCDGVNLNLQNCSSQGLGLGNLSCLNNCSGYNVSGCVSCTDTCSSLGYECEMQDVCGVSTDCGSCGGEEVCSIGSCIEIFQESLSLNNEGWTIFIPSNDTRILYVSSDGDDATGEIYSSVSLEVGSDPFSPTGAINSYATYAAAYAETRNNYPDWILMRRGDTFYESPNNQIRDGRSETEPFLIGSYGTTGLSPTFKTGVESGLNRMNTGIDFVAVSGIDFYAHTRDPDSLEFVDISGDIGFGQYIRPGDLSQSVLIEGCKFRFYAGNGPGNYGDGCDVTLRRTQILDSYSSTGAHSQGLYSNRCELVLDEVIFDHNGWYSHPSNNDVGPATMFNHNTYLSRTSNTLFKDSIFMRSSSMNNKFTSAEGTGASANITIDNNLYVDGEIGIGIGSNYFEIPLRFKNITITNNVFTDIGRSRPTERTLGWGLVIDAWDGGLVDSNYMINQRLDGISNSFAMFFRDTMRDVVVTNNVVSNLRNAEGIILTNFYGDNMTNMLFANNKIQISEDSEYTIDAGFDPVGKWAFADNVYFSDKTVDRQFRLDGVEMSIADWNVATGDNSVIQDYSFVDDTRSIETYMAMMGETATIEAFAGKLREQDRYNWDTNYTAPVVNAWIKAGFA